jgi:hypothetical protein
MPKLRTHKLFSGPVIAVEIAEDFATYQVGDRTPRQWAVYTRHADAPHFKPAQYFASFNSVHNALFAARHIAKGHDVDVFNLEEPRH